MREEDNNQVVQVLDDRNMLETMLTDMNEAEELYQPTNFWKLSNDLLIPELRTLGLTDYRRRKNSRLGGFSANDVAIGLIKYDLRKLRYINNRIVRRIPGWQRVLEKLSAYLEKGIQRKADFRDAFVYDMCWEFCRKKGENSKHAKSLELVSESLAGNPEEYFVTKSGNHYTLRFLNFYLRYAFVSQTLDLDKVETIVELGCGAGRQVEILKKLHPNTTFLLFDIPPQLYVAERYLSTVFPSDVVSYSETRSHVDFGNLQNGKIYICGSWQFPMLKGLAVDLFWNAASMQEMEPAVVANYLSIVDQSARHVFIEAVMHGHHVARRPGEPGVIEKTTFEHYAKGLPGFEIVDRAPTITCFGSATVSSSDASGEAASQDTFWSRKNGSLSVNSEKAEF